LAACCWYEFARESRAAHDEVAGYRKQVEQWRKRGDRNALQIRFGPRVQNLIQSHVLTHLGFTSGFPQTAWRSLSDKDKQHMLRMVFSRLDVERYAHTWHNPPLTFALREPGTMTLEMWKKQYRERLPNIPESDPIKSGFFSVNLKYGHAVLIEEFRKYLRHFEGKPMLESPSFTKETAKPRPPGRKSIHDALNALGAMRLRYYCHTFSEAKKIIQPLKNKPHGMFYGRRYNFNRACSSALIHFQKFFGWLDSEKPVHFTAGWSGTQKKKIPF
jgi:hypothetical protein